MLVIWFSISQPNAVAQLLLLSRERAIGLKTAPLCFVLGKFQWIWHGEFRTDELGSSDLSNPKTVPGPHRVRIEIEAGEDLKCVTFGSIRKTCEANLR